MKESVEDLTQHPPFGRWTVLRYADKRKGVRYWWCRCECGREKEVRELYLVKGLSKGCHKCGANHKKNTSCKFLDLRDQEYGKWTVTKHHRKYKNRTEWLCKCKCGTKKWVSMGNLRSGHSTQCSKCGYKEAQQKTRTIAYEHPREYAIWRQHLYHGEMAPEFKTFEAFFTSVGKRPKGCKLWRPNKTLKYQPGNAEWKRSKDVIKASREALIERVIESNQLDGNDRKVWKRLRPLSRQRLFQLLHRGPPKEHYGCGAPRKWQNPSNTPTYHVWRNLHHMNRLVKPWNDYDQFFADMGERPFKHRLYIPDKTQLVGPGNAVWRPVIRSKKAS